MNAERIATYREFIRAGGTPNILPEYVEEVLEGVTAKQRDAYIERVLSFRGRP